MDATRGVDAPVTAAAVLEEARWLAGVSVTAGAKKQQSRQRMASCVLSAWQMWHCQVAEFVELLWKSGMRPLLRQTSQPPANRNVTGHIRTAAERVDECAVRAWPDRRSDCATAAWL